MKLIRKHLRLISTFLALGFLSEILFPTAAKAVTGHDSMPEYRSFEPVSTTNMVNPFDGSFTYNIPLLDVPNGYPISLSYHNNEVSTEAQASWVGLGWTLNPGAINRVKRGFPDEFDGEKVTYFNKIPSHKTFSVSVEGHPELFGLESRILSASTGVSVSYNNYNGVGQSANIGVSGFEGAASLHLNFDGRRFGFSGEVNPGKLINRVISQSSGNMKEQSTTTQKNAQTDQEEEMKGMTRAENRSENDISEGDGGELSNSSVSQNQVSKVGRFFARIGSMFPLSTPQSRTIPLPVEKKTGVSLQTQTSMAVNVFPAPIDAEAPVRFSVNIIDTKGEQDQDVYGYMHTDQRAGNLDGMEDFYTENNNPYEKSDKFLGVPMPNNDQFLVSGEGIGGAFKPYRKDFGTYSTNKVANHTFSYSSGVDVDIPLTSPIPHTVTTYGTNLGLGYHLSKVGKWDSHASNDLQFENEDDFDNSNEKFVFRFKNDPGGNFDFVGTDDPVQADLQGLFNANLSNWSSMGNLSGNKDDNRTSRSANISFTTMGDGLESSSGSSPNSVKYRLFEKNLKVWDKQANQFEGIDFNDFPSKNICEMVSTNADGVTHIYGLPLHTRNEKNLNYSLKNGQFSLISNGLVAKVDSESDAEEIVTKSKRKIGTQSATPFATQFLLTQIQSPDYVDRTYDGPTADDFGSYTQFNYTRFAGGAGDWYNFRSPFRDLDFSYGRLIDNNDDMGGFVSGEKEIYILNSVVSKTHVAIFTTSVREDGFGVDYSGWSSGMSDEAKLLMGNKGGNGLGLQKLDRIDLYSIDDVEVNSSGQGHFQPKASAVPIKSVLFDYSYNLCPGTPNSNASTTGKLTLEKVWFEYGGKLTSRIPAYSFGYEYPNTSYPARYSTTIGQFYPNPPLNENPGYSRMGTDRWGNYRDTSFYQGLYGDLFRFFPFVTQNENVYQQMDPASWMLKRIALPSGGEIHVQYEPHDYCYVQDLPASVMIPIHEESGESTENKAKYYLDLSKIGMDVEFNSASVSEKEKFLHKLFSEIGKDNQRMFFRFLFGMTSSADFTNGESEYLEGFGRIDGYGYDYISGLGTNLPFFSFKDVSSSSNYYHKITYPGNGKYSKRGLPREICQDFYANQARGKLGAPNVFDAESAGEKELLNALETVAKSTIPAHLTCLKFNPEFSFVRLVSPKPKLGGGVRVKRLLMYSPQLPGESEPSLYGQEYDYTTTDQQGEEISSGVAANEPQVGRRENSLVHPLQQDERSFFEAIIYGRNLYGNEGPIGESLLPGASIGYSKVTIKSIHEGETNTGKEVHDFFTWKDYPMTVQPTEIKSQGDIKIPISGIPKVPVSYTRYAPHMTQGFSINRFEINGRQRRIAKYSGGASEKLISSETFDYFSPEEPQKVMDKDYAVSEINIGKELEILSEAREVNDISLFAGSHFDITAGTAISFPVFFASLWDNLNAQVSEQILRTHVTTKIISYPAILKKTTNYTDGVTNVTENLVFDKYSGQPVVTKSYDDFSGTYMNQSFMANWAYPEMGQKGSNEGIIRKGLVEVGSDGGRTFIRFAGVSSCGFGEVFSPGDLLEITSLAGGSPCAPGGSGVSLYHVDEIIENQDKIFLQESGISDCSMPQGLKNLSFKVLRSGKTNELSAAAGGLMAHDENGQVNYFSNTGGTNPLSALLSNNRFAKDLNTALDALTASGIPPGVQTLTIVPAPGGGYTTYDSVSLAIDPCVGDASCGASPTGVSISNVQLDINFDLIQEKFGIKVKSLDVHLSGGGTETISCSGYVEIPTNVSASSRSGGNDECTGCDRENGTGLDIRFTLNPNGKSYQYDASLGVNVEDNQFCFKYGDQYYTSGLLGLYYDNANSVFGASWNKFSWKVWKHNSTGGRTLIVDLPPTTGLIGINLPDFYSITKGEYEVEVKKWPLVGLFSSGPSAVNSYFFSVNFAKPFKPTATLPNSICLSTTNQVALNLNFPRPVNFPDYDEYSDYPYNITYGVTGGSGPAGISISNPGPTNSESTTYTFSQTGTYYLVAYIENQFQECRLEYFGPIEVNSCQPCANQIAGITEICLPNNGIVNSSTSPETFTIQQSGGTCINNSCQWSLTDPSGSTSVVGTNCNYQNVSFSQPGNYLLQFSGSNSYGTIPYNHAIEVKDCRPPIASIQETSYGCPGKQMQFDAVPGSDAAINTYTWDFGDGTTGTSPTVLHSYTDCNSAYTVTLTVSNEYGTHTSTLNLPQSAIPVCHEVCGCESQFPMSNYSSFAPGPNAFTTLIGQFYTETGSNSFVYQEVGCARTYPLECIKPCVLPQSGGSTIIPHDNVVTASASLFGDNWWYEESSYHPDPDFQGNDFEKGFRGNWRPFAQYIYRKQSDRNRNFNSGRFELEMFDWKYGNNDPEYWVLSSLTTQYDPNGNPVEDVNLLGVYSSGKFGYNHTLPVLVAQNSQRSCVSFESFENLYEVSGSGSSTLYYFEDGLRYDANSGILKDDYAHTGNYSISVVPGAQIGVGAVDLNNQILSEGLVARAWLKVDPEKPRLDGKVKLRFAGHSLNMTKIANAGEWQLFEAIVEDFSSPVTLTSSTGPGGLPVYTTTATGGTPSGSTPFYIQVNGSEYAEGDIYLDDVRLQPFQAEMVCYVYDDAQRLVASFDDQHFALLYEYNTEGLLVRKLKETTRGVKTISETQYHVPGEERP